MVYRKEIDGLRAVAVLPVMLFHAGLESFSGGFVGVDVFFVISGYLITSILLAELQAGQFSLTAFYERRARRILPALLLVTASCLPFAWLWMHPHQLKEFSQSLFAVGIFASNVLFWQQSSYFDASAELKPLLHTWSLAVEEQYYLLFPLLMWTLWRIKPGLRTQALAFLALGATSLWASQWLVTQDSVAAAFYLLPSRGWELLLGSSLALAISAKTLDSISPAFREALGFSGMVLISYAIFFFDKTTPFPGLHALVPAVGAALIIAFASATTITGRLLSHRLLVGVGLISYSAYLWHQPILAFIRIRTDRADLPLPTLLMYLALVLALSYLSFQLVETPFRSRARFNSRQIGWGALAGTAFLCGLGLWGHLSGGFIAWKLALIPVEKRGILVDRERELSGRARLVVAAAPYLAQSAFSADTNKRKILVVGDSLGEDLATSLATHRELFPGHEVRFLKQNSDCLHTRNPVTQDACRAVWNRLLTDRLVAEASLILITFQWEESSDFRLLKEVFGGVAKINPTLRIIGSASFVDVASLSFRVASDDTPYSQTMIDDLIGRSRRTKFETGNKMAQGLADTLKAGYLDRNQLYCNQGGHSCRVLFRDGTALIWDGGHLTPEGMRVTAEQIASRQWLH